MALTEDEKDDLVVIDRCFEELWNSKAMLFPGNPKTAAHALYLAGAAEGARAVRRQRAAAKQQENPNAAKS
jgi:hypothetical protein